MRERCLMVFLNLFVGVKTFKKSVDLMIPLLLGEQFFSGGLIVVLA